MQTISIDNWINKPLNIISNPTNVIYPLPNTIDNVQDLFNDIILKNPKKSSRLYCTEIENCYIHSGKIFNETQNAEITEFSDCNGSNNAKSNAPIQLKNSIHLISNWGGTNYWHWIISSLSRLCLSPNIPQDTTFLINSLDSSFVSGSLKSININLDKCIEIDKVKSAHCQNLILPATMGDCDKMGLLFLREKIKNKIKPSTNAPNRIYISRKGKRIVNNESEVIDLLKTIGFHVVVCENLSFEDQVKTFSNADVVIAPHGAGLTNLLFIKDNAKVLELRSPKYFGKCYYYLSNHLGFQYYSLYGKGELPRTKERASISLYENIDVDILRLKQTLNFMNI